MKALRSKEGKIGKQRWSGRTEWPEWRTEKTKKTFSKYSSLDSIWIWDPIPCNIQSFQTCFVHFHLCFGLL